MSQKSDESSKEVPSPKKNTVATEITPKPEQAPKYKIPLKELNVGKAGVGDLFNKLNEQTRLINDIMIHLKIKKEDLLKSAKLK